MAESTYALSKHLKSTSFDDALEAVTASLKAEGFGILTEIDVKKTLKKKIDVDFRRYLILGACNPKLAHEALSAESMIGLLLPCNVILSEEDEGTMVGIINPREMFSVVNRDDMAPIVDAVEEKLLRVLASL